MIWQTSIPKLKTNIEVKNLSRGKPISFNELANPIPCISPNKNTSITLHGFNSLRIKFSSATNTMDKAMIGSITGLGATMIPFILSASETVCATVNADAW